MKKLITGLLAVVCLLAITSCSSSPEYEFRVAESTSSGSSSYPTPEITVTVPQSSDSSSYPEPTIVLVPPPSPSDSLFPGSSTDWGDEEEGSSGQSQAIDIGTERMIVRTGDIRMVVEDIAVTLEEICLLYTSPSPRDRS